MKKIVISTTAVLLCACADAQPPGNELALTPSDPPATPDMDVEVDRLTAGSSPKAIYLVGNQFALGDGVDQDQAMAERLWQRACQQQHVRACSIYGSRLIGAGDFAGAATPLETAAQAGDLDAIRNLVQLHSNANWPGASFEKRLQWMAVLNEIDGTVPLETAAE